MVKRPKVDNCFCPAYSASKVDCEKLVLLYRGIVLPFHGLVLQYVVPEEEYLYPHNDSFLYYK